MDHAPRSPGGGLISVQGASVGPLNDDIDAWPERWLGDGFTFVDFSEDDEGSTETKACKRVEWSKKRGGSFWPSHYTTLATVYQRRGQSAEARSVLIARERHRADQADGVVRLAYRFWGAISSYGYRPHRAIWGLAALIFASSTVFAFADMQPTSNIPPRFWSALYALDLAIPFANLRIADSYQPVDGWAQGVMWATIAAGWFFSAAFLAAITGIFSANE